MARVEHLGWITRVDKSRVRRDFGGLWRSHKGVQAEWNLKFVFVSSEQLLRRENKQHGDNRLLN